MTDTQSFPESAETPYDVYLSETLCFVRDTYQITSVNIISRDSFLVTETVIFYQELEAPPFVIWNTDRFV